jgi:hypothetical protein
MIRRWAMWARYHRVKWCEMAVDDVQSQLLLVPFSALSDYFYLNDNKSLLLDSAWVREQKQ